MLIKLVALDQAPALESYFTAGAADTNPPGGGTGSFAAASCARKAQTVNE